MVRSLGIIRLSKSPDEASTSIDRQTEIIERYAAEHGMELVGVAIDKAVSAFRIPPEKRPAIGAWLARPDDFDVILFWQQSRLVRRTTDLMGMLAWAREHGKKLVSCTESTGDITEHAGELLAYLRAWQDQGESESISTRVKASRARLAQEQRWPGGRVSYGTKAVSRMDGPGFKLVPDEGATADVVREAVQRVIGGESPNAVISDFNRRGIRSADGGRWSAAALRSILRNRSLMAVISPEDWVRLQETLSARTISHPPSTSSNPLLGLVFCGRCGDRIYRWHSKRDGRFYGRCRSELKRSEVTTPCTMRMIPYAILLEAAELELSDHADLMIERRVVNAGGVSKLRADDISRELMDLPVQLAAKSISRQEFTTRQAALLDEQDKLEQQDVSRTPGQAQWVSTGETVEQLWDRSGPDERRAWLQRIGMNWSVSREEGPDSWRWSIRGAWQAFESEGYLERVRRPS